MQWVSAGSCRQQRWAVRFRAKVYVKKWQAMAFQCTYIQRAGVGSGHVRAGPCRERRWAVAWESMYKYTRGGHLGVSV